VAQPSVSPTSPLSVHRPTCRMRPHPTRPTTTTMRGPPVIPPLTTARPPSVARCAPTTPWEPTPPPLPCSEALPHFFFLPSAHPSWLARLPPPPPSLVLIVQEHRPCCPPSSCRRLVLSPPPFCSPARRTDAGAYPLRPRESTIVHHRRAWSSIELAVTT
jgi:hypothetical protein